MQDGDPRAAVARLVEARLGHGSSSLGAGWIVMPAGSVLLHEGHVPPGVFVAASGALAREGGGGARLRLPVPCVVPPIGAWHAPSAHEFTVLDEAEMLFIPRSRLVHDPALGRDLELALASLCTAERPRPERP